MYPSWPVNIYCFIYILFLPLIFIFCILIGEASLESYTNTIILNAQNKKKNNNQSSCRLKISKKQLSKPMNLVGYGRRP